MRKIFLIVAVIPVVLATTSLSSCNNPASSASATSAGPTSQADSALAAARSADSTAAAWISLFDGRTLNGWHSYGKPAPGKAWQVADGSLHLQPYGHAGYQVQGGGDLVTDDAFSDFDLQLQWKIAHKGNSGIIFYVQEDTTKYKETWNTGPEMQVLDINGGGDSHSFKHDIGELYDLVPATLHPARPAMEWNKVEIVSSKSLLKLYLNDTLIITTRLWDDAWKKLIAGSKFKDMPGFGTFRQGHIALQDHGDEIWFKDIRIRKL
ncbi:MAG TPA: DUF1080 domain-containing protein [Puia sp.]|nr:DUF1080 domain-containing protein [Puia sp.]